MSYSDLPAYWDANTTVVPKSIVPEGYQGMISIPISPEEQAAVAKVESPSWYNYFSDKITSFGNTVGFTTDPNNPAMKDSTLSTPQVTQMGKDIAAAVTGGEVSESGKAIVSDPIGAVSASWQKWGNETLIRVALAALALLVIYLALRKMV